MNGPVRVLVVEDEVTTRSAIVALLEMDAGIEVVGEADDGLSALDRARALAPDVVLSDLEMPRMDGLGLVEALRGAADDGGSAASSGVRVVLLTRHTRPGALRRAIELEVAGVLTKETPVERIAEVIREVHAGGTHYDPRVVELSWAEPSPLTDRETEVLRAAATGAPIAEIAGDLHLARGTVRNYLSRVMTRVHARTRHEAAREAERRGWI